MHDRYFAWICIACLLLTFLLMKCEVNRYQDIKKHYPDITWVDYLLSREYLITQVD
jgi:hypothetical protein